MLAAMKDLPKGVIGFSAEGTVTDENYKSVLIPAVEEALKSGGRIRFLYYLGPGFESFAAGAMRDDTLFGVRHYFDFEKIACVTDSEIFTTMIKGLGFLMPAEIRAFPVAELDAAKAWLAA